MTSRSIGFELFYSKLFLAHDFFLCRLNISQICVLDYYGGPHYVPVDEYFRVKLYSDTKKGKELRMNHTCRFTSIVTKNFVIYFMFNLSQKLIQ